MSQFHLSADGEKGETYFHSQTPSESSPHGLHAVSFHWFFEYFVLNQSHHVRDGSTCETGCVTAALAVVCSWSSLVLSKNRTHAGNRQTPRNGAPYRDDLLESPDEGAATTVGAPGTNRKIPRINTSSSRLLSRNTSEGRRCSAGKAATKEGKDWMVRSWGWVQGSADRWRCVGQSRKKTAVHEGWTA